MDIDGHSPVPDAAAATDVLRSAIGRDGSELTATETLEDELAAADSLDHMLERYEHVVTTHRPEVDVPLEQATLIDGLGPDAHRVAIDPKFDALVTRASHLRAAQVDVSEKLVSLDRCALARATSPAEFVAKHLGEVGAGTRTNDPAMNRWLEGMEDTIRPRLAEPPTTEAADTRALARVRTAWKVTSPTPVVGIAPDVATSAADARAARIQARVDQLRGTRGVRPVPARTPKPPTPDVTGPVL